MRIVRNCVVCGDELKINVNSKRHYDNGYYFGIMKVPIKGTGVYKQVGTFKMLNEKIPVTEWTGKEKEVEYWECNLCYDAAQRENWLEERIRKWYGKRCPDFEPSCPCCDAWALSDNVIKNSYLRGKFKQTFDKETNAAYIYIKPKSKIKAGEAVRQLELSDYIILDFNKRQELLGIEILSARKNFPKVFTKPF